MRNTSTTASFCVVSSASSTSSSKLANTCAPRKQGLRRLRPSHRRSPLQAARRNAAHLRDVGHQVGAVAGEDGDHGGGLAGHVVQTDARGALDLQRLRDGQLLVVLAVVAVDGRGGGRRRIGAAVA
eukprot:scaffold1320_cov326-Prasinococcus_capsulatus_cf.AAC.1